MEWNKAAQIVADDQNAGVSTEAGETLYTVEEAVAHARNILTPETLTDYADENTEAYRLILTENPDGTAL